MHHTTELEQWFTSLNHLLHAATQTQLFTTNQPISHSTPNTSVSKSSNPTSNQKQKTKTRETLAGGLAASDSKLWTGVWSRERMRDGRVVTSRGVLAHQRRRRFPRRWWQDRRRPWGGWTRWRRYPASETSRPWRGSVQLLFETHWRSEGGDAGAGTFRARWSEGRWCRRWSLRRRSLVRLGGGTTESAAARDKGLMLDGVYELRRD